MRFEEPNSMARWDSPLFYVNIHENVPCADICNALFQAIKQKPNMSTQNPPLMTPEFLSEVDKVLQVMIR